MKIEKKVDEAKRVLGLSKLVRRCSTSAARPLGTLNGACLPNNDEKTQERKLQGLGIGTGLEKAKSASQWHGSLPSAVRAIFRERS